MACLGRRDVQSLVVRRIVRQPNRGGEGLIDFGTRQIGHGVGIPALIHDDEIALLVEAYAGKIWRLPDRVSSRTAGHVDDGIRRRRLLLGRYDRDRQLNLPSLRLLRFSGAVRVPQLALSCASALPEQWDMAPA